ncbi:MAG: cobalamin biosynthesis protein CbiD [Oscillospiraceae bacterium]|nr:cobalamin biosynthesis protein CbiD [Oscillospiraceae bacterium]
MHGGWFHSAETGSVTACSASPYLWRGCVRSVSLAQGAFSCGKGESGTISHQPRWGAKHLRCGYTTGTCAALAASGAVDLLLGGRAPERVSLVTPAGTAVTVPLAEAVLLDGGDSARCAVVKDGGDDPDITSGMLVCATVKRIPAGIQIDGGAGVGRVTKPGLDQPVGAAAINRVPRRMIKAQVRQRCEALGYTGGIAVTISIPGGAKAAEKTFNPMLGVVGGLSILGTSGIVEPMSERAIIDTIAIQERQAAVLGARGLILTPGNYGVDFLQRTGWIQPQVPVVKCSNFIGEALDCAAELGFAQVLLVGHIGKLVKVAGGIMNTHSRAADCRMELFCAYSAVCGADAALCRGLMEAATTDACIALLDEAGLRAAVLDRLLDAIQRRLEQRAAGAYEVGAVVFSNEYGLLGETRQAGWIRGDLLQRKLEEGED